MSDWCCKADIVAKDFFQTSSGHGDCIVALPVTTSDPVVTGPVVMLDGHLGLVVAKFVTSVMADLDESPCTDHTRLPSIQPKAKVIVRMSLEDCDGPSTEITTMLILEVS